MGNGRFYSCLIEPQSVSAWLKETTQAHVSLLSRSVLLNHHHHHHHHHFIKIQIWQIFKIYTTRI